MEGQIGVEFDLKKDMEKIIEHINFKILITCVFVGVLNFLKKGFDANNIPYEFLICISLTDIYLEVLQILQSILPIIAIVLFLYTVFICFTILALKGEYWWLFNYKGLIKFLVDDKKKLLYYKNEGISIFKKIPYFSLLMLIGYIVLSNWFIQHELTLFLHFVFLPTLAGLMFEIIQHHNPNFIISRKAMIFGAYIIATLAVSSNLSTNASESEHSTTVIFCGKDDYYNSKKYVQMLNTSTHIVLKNTLTSEYEKLKKDPSLCYRIKVVN